MTTADIRIYGVGRTRTGEWDMEFVPDDYCPGRSGAVIYCHGHGGTANLLNDPALNGQWKMLQALSASYPVIVADLAFNSWGNANARAAMAGSKTLMQAAPIMAKAGKVALVGVSMGFTTAVSYAMSASANVACIAGILPVCNVQAARSVASLNTTINAAFGITDVQGVPAEYETATKGPALVAANIPVKLWAASDDAIVPIATINTFAATAAATVVPVGALGHTEAAIAAVDDDALRNFIHSVLQ